MAGMFDNPTPATVILVAKDDYSLFDMKLALFIPIVDLSDNKSDPGWISFLLRYYRYGRGAVFC